MPKSAARGEEERGRRVPRVPRVGEYGGVDVRQPRAPACDHAKRGRVQRPELGRVQRWVRERAVQQHREVVREVIERGRAQVQVRRG